MERALDKAGWFDRLSALGVLAAALLSGWMLLRTVHEPLLAAAFAGGVVAAGALLLFARYLFPPKARTERAVDWTLVRDAADNGVVAVAVTDRSGHTVCTNALFDRWFGEAAPGAQGAASACGKAAWRDGIAATDLMQGERHLSLEVVRAGLTESCLVWRFAENVGAVKPAAVAAALIAEWGDRLGEAGIMVALLAPDGGVRAANRVLGFRATGHAEAGLEGKDFAGLLATDAGGVPHFAREAASAPLRLLHIPLEESRAGADQLVVLLDAEGTGAGGSAVQDVSLQMLLSMLPLGLALADRDGRLLYLNSAFARAAGLASGETPTYPGDFVIREDKAAVADAVRRYANAQGTSDLAVRIAARPDEPVALTVAGARGLGEAAVLLSLKDNSEENKLQRQVAQATKMQAVGQLAGGVAHDFNNILTAIIGACDLMLMRHGPGDSDYDDIQQIRNNSNRAAALTRQLLAFSRQQTLRPQVLQLPDVVSEVSNLLQRLIGDQVDLVIQHGRALGAVRADPGQLEQVIVNLAINARDAMVAKGTKGTLTLRTYGVRADEVKKLGSDILPVADYTALSVADTGTGIPPEILGKVFEPFFTTKEVGRGTGLGLSTVYGIVKQSGGFIFADSKPGEGTTFTIYLPVHAEVPSADAVVPKRAEKPQELWGTGTVLVVEDEDMVRAVAERALTRQGYTVLTATQGEEALDVLAREKVDLLVSDVVMPTMDGPTLGREARARYPDLPILFMSGYAEEQLRRSIDLPRMGFIAKPFSVKALAEAVQAALAMR